MGQLNIKDESLIAEAKDLAALLGTSATDAVRQAVRERLERERQLLSDSDDGGSERTAAVEAGGRETSADKPATTRNSDAKERRRESKPAAETSEPAPEAPPTPAPQPKPVRYAATIRPRAADTGPKSRPEAGGRRWLKRRRRRDACTGRPSADLMDLFSSSTTPR
jgi:hypothetical protein